MRTFVINLPSARDRLKNIELQLNNLGIKFEVFPAIYGKSLSKKELEKYYDENKAKNFLGKELTLGEVGCALSHYFLFKKIVEENIDLALILEDDAIISKDIKKIYDKLVKKGTNWDYISLNYGIFNRKEIKRYGLYIYNKFFKKGKILKFLIHFFGMFFFSFVDYFFIFISNVVGPFIIRKYKASYLTGGYFITKKGAKKLLKIHDKVFVPSDFLPEKFGNSVGLRFALSIPCLVNQNEGFDSCIDAQGERKI